MIKIKKGTCRTVFIFEKFVIKIPTFHNYKLFLHGILANLQEKLFNGCHEDLAKVLYAHDSGLFLVMERAELLGNVNKEFFVKTLTEKYSNDDFEEFLLSDLKPDNWGYINDRLVKIDYGS